MFGRDRDPNVAEVAVGIGRVKDGKGRLGAFKSNPLVPLYGPGPEGARCGDCVHIVAHRYSKTYYKCDLRGDGAGPATDHRVGWQACAKYEEYEEE